MTRITRRSFLAAAGAGLAAQAPARRNTTPIKLYSVFFDIAPSRVCARTVPALTSWFGI